MKNITKFALNGLIVPFLLIPFTVLSMDQGIDTASAQKIINEMTIPKYKIDVLGTIELTGNATVGYVNADYVQQLNNANIKTRNNDPLVPINVWIENPKKKPDDKQTHANWTNEVPTIVTKQIDDLCEKVTTDAKTKLIALLGNKLTHQNNDLWMNHDWNAAAIENNAAKLKKTSLFPALIPAHYLMTSPVRISNLFNCYNVQLNFKGHEQLSNLMETFHKSPTTIFSSLSPKTTQKWASLLLYRTHYRQELANNINSLAHEIDAEVLLSTKEACKELKNNNIVRKNRTADRSNDILAVIWPNIASYQSESYMHGQNGCLENTFRERVLTRELGENPIEYFNARQVTTKKPAKKFTYSLK